jgi:hypothetical protein
MCITEDFAYPFIAEAGMACTCYWKRGVSAVAEALVFGKGHNCDIS